LAVALLWCACGGGDSAGPDAATGPATVRLALANNTPGLAAAAWTYGGDETPDVLDLKLISVRMVPLDFDVPALVYLHPDCSSEASCGLEAGTGVTEVIGDYLPLMQPGPELQADLAAVDHEVMPGRYAGVTVRWQRDGSTAATARYRMESWQAGAAVEFVWNELAVQDFLATSPFELLPGQDHTVTLSFNVEGLLLTNQSVDGCAPTNDPTCYSEGSDRWFIVGRPEFGVSAD
jgi:hypothetical protein